MSVEKNFGLFEKKKVCEKCHGSGFITVQDAFDPEGSNMLPCPVCNS